MPMSKNTNIVRVQPDSMYEKLLRLPLFQGLRVEDLNNLLEKLRVQFVHYKAGQTIMRQGLPCTKLIFILSGEIRSTQKITEPFKYSVSETFQGPYLIEPSCLFGRYTDHMYTHHSVTEVTTLQITKQEALDVLFEFPLIRLNHINMVSARAQIMQHKAWTIPPNDVLQRAVCFIRTRLENTIGTKRIQISLRSLGLGVNSSHVTMAEKIKLAEDAGLIYHDKTTMVIEDFNKLEEFAETYNNV